MIKSTGGAAGVTAEQVGELAEEMTNLAGVDDELIAKGANVLLSFTEVANRGEDMEAIFDRATVAGLDLATRGFGSVETNAKLLGLALSAPEEAFSKLRRAGVLLSDQQQASIEHFVAVGDQLKAQQLLLDAIEAKVGGAAEAYGNTLPGKLAIAKETLTNLKAELVSGAAPAIELFADSATSAVHAISGLPDPIKNVIGGLGALAFVASATVPTLASLSTILSLQATRRAAAAAATTVETAALGANSVAQATNSAASVAGLYQTEAALARSSTAFGLWGVAVAAGIVLASTAIDIWGGKTKNTFSDLQFYAGETAKELRNTFLDIKWEGNPEDAGKFITFLAESGETGVGTLQRLSTELHATGEDATLVDKALAGAVVSQQNMNEATDIGADVLVDYAAQVRENVDAIKDLDSAYKGISGATLSAFEAELSLQDARARSLTTQAELTEMTRTRTGTEEELAAKTNDVFQAILNEAKAAEGLAAAQAAANGVQLEAKDSNASLIASLQASADAMAPGSPVRVQLETYIAELQRVPSTVLTTAVADTREAIVALQLLQRQVLGIPAGVHIETSVSAAARGQARAGGGPVYAGMMHEVNEGGRREFFAPAVNGTILSADALSQAVSQARRAPVDASGVAIGPIVIHVDGTGLTRATARQLGDEIGAAVVDRVTPLAARRMTTGART